MSNAERQARWRESTSLKRIELYLTPETLDRLDALVQKRMASGRAAVIEALIRQRLPVDIRRELLEAYQTLMRAATHQRLGAAHVQAILGKAMQKLSAARQR